MKKMNGLIVLCNSKCPFSSSVCISLDLNQNTFDSENVNLEAMTEVAYLHLFYYWLRMLLTHGFSLRSKYLTADHILVSAFLGGEGDSECSDTDSSVAAYMQSTLLELCVLISQMYLTLAE